MPEGARKRVTKINGFFAAESTNAVRLLDMAQVFSGRTRIAVKTDHANCNIIHYEGVGLTKVSRK